MTNHLKSFFVLSKGRSGVSSVKMVFVQAESSLTKDWRSVRLASVGTLKWHL